MPRQFALIIAPTLALALSIAACSQPADPQQTAMIDAAFDEGFDLDVLTYDWSESRTEALEKDMAAALPRISTVAFRRSDPSALLTTGQARVMMQRELKARGLPEHSLAGATALFFGVAWELTNQQTLEPWQHTALLSQSATQLRASWRGRGDRARQIEADARALIAAVWLHEARLSQGDPAALSALSDALHQDLLATGNDLRTQVITADGFADREEGA